MCVQCSSSYEYGFELEWSLMCKKCNIPLELDCKEQLAWIDMDQEKQGVWRYLPLIPVSKESSEKMYHSLTPEFYKPIEVKKLAEKLGVESVYVLPCTSGPSGTFKDAEAAVVLAKCLDWNLHEQLLSWHSTGNTARAYREYAIRGDFKSNSYFPLSCLSKWRGIASDQYNTLIAYDGPFQDISKLAKERSKELHSLHLAPLHWKIEGKATLAYSLFEHIPSANVIVQTIAGGYGILGIELGLSRLKKAGLFSGNAPRYELFQIDGADTIARLMPLNRDITETDLKLPVNPFEPTLQSTNPLSTFNALRKILESSHSGVHSLMVDEVVNEHEFFEDACANEGIEISFEDEKSPYISWAGIVKRSLQNTLKPTDTIALIITGSPKRKGDIPKPDEVIKAAS